MHASCRSSIVKSSIGGNSSIIDVSPYGVSPFVSTPPFLNAPSSALITPDFSNLQRSTKIVSRGEDTYLLCGGSGMPDRVWLKFCNV